jgi:hypothetical protein
MISFKLFNTFMIFDYLTGIIMHACMHGTVATNLFKSSCQTKTLTYHAAIEAAAGGRDDLTTTSMDGIGVQGNIIDVEANSAHVLIAEGSLLGGPLEASDD